MKPKTMILMVVAVACGLGASYMTSRLIGQSQQAPQVPTVPVLVAKTRIPSWQPIKDPEKVFEIKQYPENVAPKNPISAFTEIKDQRLKNFLEEGKPLTQDDLVNKDMASLEAKILPGQRATAIRVNTEQIVGGFILPGSRVDIFCTFRAPEVVTKLILQNMLVLAADTTDTKNTDTKAILAQTITLAATLEEGARLALAANSGELRLFLRNPGDQDRHDGSLVVKLADLDRPIKPSKADDETRPVEESKDPAGVAKGVDVPVIPAEKKDEPKVAKRGPDLPAPIEKPEDVPQPKKPTPIQPRVEEEQLAPKKPRFHVMRILQGASTTRVVFPLDEKDEDEAEEGAEDAPPTPRSQPRAAQPKTNPTPGPGNAPTKTRSTRTGS